MAVSRTKNTTRNIGAGFINQSIRIIFQFLNRTFLIILLGAEYSGLNGLFSSVLQMFNVAEMGFNIVIVYSMYKPVADNNSHEVCRLLTLYRRIYRKVGCIIFVLGMIVLPFLPYFIKGDVPSDINLYVLFILYLFDATGSYWLFSYTESVFLANQRQDISQNIRSVFLVIQNLLQFAVLYLTRSYYSYFCIKLLCTVFTNITFRYCSMKKYPQYHCVKEKVELTPEMKEQVGGLVINRVSDVTRNSFDNIILSTLLGLTTVAIYTNYYYIMWAIYSIMLMVANSMNSSVGNSIAIESQEKNKKDLMKFSFIYSWMTGICTCMLLCLYQPFMKFWVGDKLMFNEMEMVLLCIYFYVLTINNIRNQFISGAGIWHNLRKSYLMEMSMNLLLNFILGKLWGVSGILIATILTVLVFNYISRTMVLFRIYFKSSSKEFFMEQLLHMIVTVIACVAAYFLCISIVVDGIVINLIFRALVSFLTFNLIFIVLYHKSERFGEAIIFLKNIFAMITS